MLMTRRCPSRWYLMKMRQRQWWIYCWNCSYLANTSSDDAITTSNRFILVVVASSPDINMMGNILSSALPLASFSNLRRTMNEQCGGDISQYISVYQQQYSIVIWSIIQRHDDSPWPFWYNSLWFRGILLTASWKSSDYSTIPPGIDPQWCRWCWAGMVWWNHRWHSYSSSPPGNRSSMM